MCIVSDDRHRCRCDDCSSATPSHDRCDYLTQIRRVLYGYLAIGRIDRICSRCTVGMTTTSQIFCSFPYVVYCYYSRRINSTRCQNTCSWSICTSGIWSCGRSSGWTCTAAVLPHRSGWMDEIVVTFCMTQQLWFSTGRHHTFSFAYIAYHTTKILQVILGRIDHSVFGSTFGQRGNHRLDSFDHSHDASSLGQIFIIFCRMMWYRHCDNPFADTIQMVIYAGTSKRLMDITFYDCVASAMIVIG